MLVYFRHHQATEIRLGSISLRCTNLSEVMGMKLASLFLDLLLEWVCFCTLGKDRSLEAGRCGQRYRRSRSRILSMIGMGSRLISWSMILRKSSGIAGKMTGIRQVSSVALMPRRSRVATWHAHRRGRGGETGKRGATFSHDTARSREQGDENDETKAEEDEELPVVVHPD